MERVDRQIREYVERHIVPLYSSFDAGHGVEHVETVIRQSLALASFYDVDCDMVYLIAAFHDAGLGEGREFHHLNSAKRLAADCFVRSRFSEEQILTMVQAVEDHRASSKEPPRSIYGRIVAEADRVIETKTIIRRAVQFGLQHQPDALREEQYERMRDHVREKYGEGGYIRFWCPESGNAERMAELRRVISNEKALRSLFDEIYDELMP